MENARLKRNLKTEIELALSGSATAGAGEAAEPSVVLLLRQGLLPMALVTDERGVATPKVLDYVDLLSALDRSSVVTELERDPVKVHEIPALPHGAMLLSMTERPSGNSFVVTGTIPPDTHVFLLERRGETTTHEVPLPHVAYRAEWDARTCRVGRLSIALCSPGLAGRPTAQTELYRYPFSNVYGVFSGVLEGACWPTIGRIRAHLSEIPEKIVHAFFGIPNDADNYGRDISGSAPFEGYRAFLEGVEARGGLHHDWLEPCSMTIRDLHDQTRRES